MIRNNSKQAGQRVYRTIVFATLGFLTVFFSLEALAVPSYHGVQYTHKSSKPSSKNVVSPRKNTSGRVSDKFHPTPRQDAEKIPGNSAKTGIGTNSKGRNFANAAASPAVVQEAAGKANPEIKPYLDASFPGGKIHHDPDGKVSEKGGTIVIPGQDWPAVIPPYAKEVDEFEMAAWKSANKLLGFDGPAGRQPATNSGMAGAAIAANMQELARMQMPETWMPIAREMQNQENRISADNFANLERCQAAAAIDFCRTFLTNFTAEGSNKWNRLRNTLFVPIAMLILLPGAVLAQVRATIAQGFSVFGNVNPFDGIIRAIIAVFLIPGTFLVVNYGIDLSNSISHTIRNQYKSTFDSDMYSDAMAAHIRAFPVRQPHENKNFIPNDTARMDHCLSGSDTALARLEGRSLSTKIMDVATGENIVPPDRADEMLPYFVHAQRSNFNGLNAALATTWSILCAFQMVYLYYLWFVGPIVAALWVWPMRQLRQAFPNWIDGVVTICFWSLFWNTSILLMACFRGVDETGTVVMSALNFLTTASVKSAFDFSGLVRSAGNEAGKMADEHQGEGPSTSGQHSSAGRAQHPASSPQSVTTGHSPDNSRVSGGNENMTGVNGKQDNARGASNSQLSSRSPLNSLSYGSQANYHIDSLQHRLEPGKSNAASKASRIETMFDAESGPGTGNLLPWENNGLMNATRNVHHVPPPLSGYTGTIDTDHVPLSTSSNITMPPSFREHEISDAVIGLRPPNLLSDSPGADNIKMATSFAVMNETARFRQILAASDRFERARILSGIGGPLAAAFDQDTSSSKLTEANQPLQYDQTAPTTGASANAVYPVMEDRITTIPAHVSPPPPLQNIPAHPAYVRAMEPTHHHPAGEPYNQNTAPAEYYSRIPAEPVASGDVLPPNHIPPYQNQSFMRISQEPASFPQTYTDQPEQNHNSKSNAGADNKQFSQAAGAATPLSFKKAANTDVESRITRIITESAVHSGAPPLSGKSSTKRTTEARQNRLNQVLGPAVTSRPEKRHMSNQEANLPRRSAKSA